MRELLVRYLMGELNAEEQSQLEQRLRESPDLRRELAYLQTCFAESNDSDRVTAEPPRGLAERTTERVAGCASEPGDVDLFDIAAGRVAAFAGAADPPAGPLGWSFADVTVAAGVCLAVSMLLLPALRNSQDATRRVSCANNQREFYVVFAKFAEDHGGLLPQVKRNECAGVTIVRVVSQGYVNPEDIRRWLVCSSSPFGEAVRNGQAQIFIPTEMQLRELNGEALARLFRTTTGSYGVPLPFVQEGEYNYLRLVGSDEKPILADGPNFNVVGIASTNHYGGQNVLLAGGCVKFLTSARLPQWDDHLYLNVLGTPAAGRGPHDTVLVAGDRTPGIEPISLPQ